jgi:glycine/D-amino acid oxidase-like deaminating enzyme
VIRRRRFLQAALAAPWLAGCAAQQPTDRIEGAILGSNHSWGHRLRTPAEPFTGKRVRTDVLIAGGGIAGLSAAWRLGHGGLDDFLLLELENTLGGNSRAQSYPESAAPWAAHYLPVPTRESRSVQRILEEMGLLLGFSPAGEPLYSEMDLCHANEERLWAFGAWEEGMFPRFGASQAELQQLHAFEEHVAAWQRRRDKQGRKPFAIPVHWSSRDPEILALDRVSMAEYLRRQGWDSPRLRWFVEYGCRDDYGTSLENTSAWAGLHYFAARDGGGFEPQDAQFVWPEGNHQLVRHLSRGLGARLRTGMLVSRVQKRGRWWEVDAFNGAGVQGFEARSVIFALPTFLRPYVLGEQPRRDFTYSPWTVSNVVLSRTPPSAYAPRVGLSWDNVLYDSPSLGYVVATHQTLSHRQGPSVWTHYRPWTELEPHEARQRMLAATWPEVRDAVLSELGTVHPDLRPLVRRVDVMQLGHAMIRPTPGFVWGATRQPAAMAREGLHFAHSDLSGLSIFEEANYHGVRAAQEVLGMRNARAEDFL